MSRVGFCFLSFDSCPCLGRYTFVSFNLRFRAHTRMGLLFFSTRWRGGAPLPSVSSCEPVSRLKFRVQGRSHRFGPVRNGVRNNNAVGPVFRRTRTRWRIQRNWTTWIKNRKRYRITMKYDSKTYADRRQQQVRYLRFRLSRTEKGMITISFSSLQPCNLCQKCTF